MGKACHAAPVPITIQPSPSRSLLGHKLRMKCLGYLARPRTLCLGGWCNLKCPGCEHLYVCVCVWARQWTIKLNLNPCGVSRLCPRVVTIALQSCAVKSQRNCPLLHTWPASAGHPISCPAKFLYSAISCIFSAICENTWCSISVLVCLWRCLMKLLGENVHT